MDMYTLHTSAHSTRTRTHTHAHAHTHAHTHTRTHTHPPPTSAPRVQSEFQELNERLSTAYNDLGVALTIQQVGLGFKGCC